MSEAASEASRMEGCVVSVRNGGGGGSSEATSCTVDDKCAFEARKNFLTSGPQAPRVHGRLCVVDVCLGGKAGDRQGVAAATGDLQDGALLEGSHLAREHNGAGGITATTV